MFTIESPTFLRISNLDNELDKIDKLLTYKSDQAEFAYKKFKNNKWLYNRMGQVAFAEREKELKEAITVKLLNFDKHGTWTYSGLLPLLKSKYPNVEINNNVNYLESEILPWKEIPPPLRYYQNEALEALLKAKHGAVSMSTGVGKSFLLLNLAKKLGLKTVIITPSTNIAEQLYSLFTRFLGKGRVGMYGGGKKIAHKLITVAIDDSLTRIQPGSELWDEFSKTQVLAWDESHTSSASTLREVCFGLLRDVPYRFFVSGTQTRNDGSELMLQGIIGPIAYEYNTKRAVDEGFLAKPNFTIVQVESDNDYESVDANAMTRKHLFYNDNVNRTASSYTNLFVKEFKQQVLILVDEIEQFARLYPYFQFPVQFAHGPLNESQKKLIDEKFHNVDNFKLVERFNNKEFPILVGTSSVSTGTDFTTVNTIILIQSGKSEIKFKQAVGRGTRKAEGKDKFNVIDFDVTNIPILHRHSQERIKIFQDIYPQISYL